MTKRFAIIIESGNVAGQDDLPGARKDAKNWEAFLRSNAGGAWSEDEICVLHKPTSAEILDKEALHQDEYIFFVFSGHGEEFRDRRTGQYSTRICLNENELSVDAKSLVPSRFGTSLFDCCRGVEGGRGHMTVLNSSARAARGTIAFMTLSSKSASDDDVTESGKTFSVSEKGCRSRFLNALDFRTQDPTVYMYSCGIDEGAGEDPEAGGYYTTLLIKGAEDWFKKQKSKRNYDIFTTRQAHDYAVEQMRMIAPQQHPTYEPTGQQYPFAVG